MKKLIGDKAFYKKVFAIALPIMLQNGISNFVSLLDNIMVGRLGTEQMSGVSIVNQLIFIFFLCTFGAIGGAGIFTAQYYGQKNDEGIQNTFRFKWILGLIILVLFSCIFYFFKTNLISLYLHEGSAEGDLAATLAYGETYMLISIIGLIPVIIEQVYASTLRECGETVVPMIASITAVFINLIFNYILIFGHFGAPAMGVAGAAVATNISRIIAVLILVIWTHKNAKRFPFVTGLYKTFRVPSSLVKKILIMATPLVINETMWSAGIAAMTQIYSSKGLAVVAALNINSTINNVFNIVFIALGDSVAIIVGQLLGAGKFEEGRDTAYKIITVSTFLCVIIGGILYLFAPLFPQIYNTSEEVRDLASGLIRMCAILMPINAFLHATYFTIRSGGKTIITFLFDGGFLWVVSVPLAYFLVHNTMLGIVLVYLIVEGTNAIKAFIGWLIMRSGIWMQNIVNE